MKYFVITDSTDTQVGLRLAGIEGVVVREEALARAAIQTAAARSRMKPEYIGLLTLLFELPCCSLPNIWPTSAGT